MTISAWQQLHNLSLRVAFYLWDCCTLPQESCRTLSIVSLHYCISSLSGLFEVLPLTCFDSHFLLPSLCSLFSLSCPVLVFLDAFHVLFTALLTLFLIFARCLYCYLGENLVLFGTFAPVKNSSSWFAPDLSSKTLFSADGA